MEPFNRFVITNSLTKIQSTKSELSASAFDALILELSIFAETFKNRPARAMPQGIITTINHLFLIRRERSDPLIASDLRKEALQFSDKALSQISTIFSASNAWRFVKKW